MGDLADNWNKHSVHALSLPTGAGKSFVARAIQLQTDAEIVTPSNILVNQYSECYPDVNVVKGKARYQCHKYDGLSCADVDDLELDCDGKCAYRMAKARAFDGEHSFFNPMSLFYTMMNDKYTNKDTIIIDEFHSFVGMLRLLTGKRFRYSEYQFPSNVSNEIVLTKFLDTAVNKLVKMHQLYLKQKAYKEASKIMEEIMNVNTVLHGFKHNPANYVVWIEDGKHRGKPEKYLNIRPIEIPDNVCELFRRKKMVFLSGTLFEHDIKSFIGNRPYKLYDLPSPIPKENRQVFYRPAPFKINFTTDPQLVADIIDELYQRDTSLNTIAHLSYSMIQKVSPLLKSPHISNTSEDKTDKLEEFKRRGGLFLAGGCSEGLDLAEDLARRNIIVKLNYPNLGDKLVAKRRSLPDGDLWYALETLKHLVQASGRSTRSETDYSETYVTDPTFGSLVNRYRKHLPKYFLESIVWSM